MPNQYTTGHAQRIPVSVRFYAKVSRTPACWHWTGSIKKNGYGRFGVSDGDIQLAHHVAWELVAGPIPDGHSILHTCDYRACVRNDDEGTYELNGLLLLRRGHLVLGTVADNNFDMAVKGRSCSGILNGQAKLTVEQVVEIRYRYAHERIRQRDLGREYGMSQTTISDIVHRRLWRNV